MCVLRDGVMVNIATTLRRYLSTSPNQMNVYRQLQKA